MQGIWKDIPQLSSHLSLMMALIWLYQWLNDAFDILIRNFLSWSELVKKYKIPKESKKSLKKLKGSKKMPEEVK